jgi:hypothetical protein
MAKILRFPPLAVDLGDHVRVAKEGHTPYEATVTIPPDYFGNVYLLVDQKFLEGLDGFWKVLMTTEFARSTFVK